MQVGEIAHRMMAILATSAFDHVEDLADRQQVAGLLPMSPEVFTQVTDQAGETARDQGAVSGGVAMAVGFVVAIGKQFQAGAQQVENAFFAAMMIHVEFAPAVGIDMVQGLDQVHPCCTEAQGIGTLADHQPIHGRLALESHVDQDQGTDAACRAMKIAQWGITVAPGREATLQQTQQAAVTLFGVEPGRQNQMGATPDHTVGDQPGEQLDHAPRATRRGSPFFGGRQVGLPSVLRGVVTQPYPRLAQVVRNPGVDTVDLAGPALQCGEQLAPQQGQLLHVDLLGGVL